MSARRLASTLGLELRLQRRHHVLTANALSTAFIAGFVALIPESARSPIVSSFFVFADPALVGLSFIGAVVLTEKASGVNRALGVAPMTAPVYLAAKLLTLSAWGTLSGLVVALAARGAHVGWPGLLVALVLSNLVAALIGFIMAARARSMNQLMMRLTFVALALFAPALAHFGVTPAGLDGLFVVVPSTPMLWLLREAFEASPEPRLVWAGSALLLAWLVALGRIAVRAAETEVLADAR